MQKYFILVLISVLLSPLIANAATSDTPGDGFAVGDVCGFVMGRGETYGSGTVNFTSVTDKNQGCVDADGNFYSSSSRESYAYYVYAPTGGNSTTYIMDFDWSSVSATNMVVDRTTGEWTCGRGSQCFARFTSSSLSDRYVWFDWECASGTPCYGQDTSKYRVYTDVDTGAVSGYAWNDLFGFLSFTGNGDNYEITQEMPPREIITYVDVLTYDEDGMSEITPEQADYLNAPVADSYDYWRIRVQFVDTVTGDYLTKEDVDYLEISPSATNDSGIYLNQVEDSGDALIVSYKNSYVGCTDSTAFCEETESDGSISFNKYIYAGSPTSNVLGLNDDSDTAIEYYSDRDGCKWIYQDQWEEVSGLYSEPGCPGGTTNHELKEDVFTARQDDRNKYEIEYITIVAGFTGDTALDMYEYDTGETSFSSVGTTYNTDDTWLYVPVEDSLDLKFHPRFQIENFAAYYDDAEHTTISSDATKTMSLITEASTADNSAPYQAAGGEVRPYGFDVYYQLDAESDSNDPVKGDMYLLMDTDDPADSVPSRDVEETHRESYELASSSGTRYYYNTEYAMTYGQKASDCETVAGCSGSTNMPLTNPTAEQWVCDFVESQYFQQNFDGPSCYYTEYLPHTDRHVNPPEAMLVVGAINSVIDDSDLLDENYVSVLGTAETISLRNKMYAQVARYVLGETDAGSGTLTGDGLEASGDIVELMNGRLLYANGDVTIEGCSGGCTGINKTLVVIGGDVFIDGDITGTKLGIVSFASGGVGGDVWVRYDVNNLYTNMFLDGTLFSYSGYEPTASYPTWYSDEVRLEYLMNQLYLKGSLVSRNTVNGAEDPDASPSVWPIGDGTTSTGYNEAREYDLNLMRQYRLCYVLNADGTLSTTTEECSEGETLSEYVDDAGASVYNSLIIEYNPASDLPVFNVESGLFR